jgi:putative nucleotidyltransferase with HDIG domain
MRKKALMTVNDIKKIIHQIPELPAMPNVVAIALDVMKDPKASVKKLCDVISSDPAITTELLKVVNSAYYGLPQQITTINQATALLGFNKVRNLILSCAVKPMLMSHGGKSLWEHSVRTAIGAEIIGKSLGRSDADECFVFGLLHDVGKIVFEIYNKSATLEVDRLVAFGADRSAAEKMMFGFDHSEAGEELITKWRLPQVIRSCVKYHHKPQLSEFPGAVGIIYAADRIVQEPIQYPILETEIINAIDFDLPDPLVLREQILEKSDQLIRALSKS